MQLLERVEGSRVYTRLVPMANHALGRQDEYRQSLATLIGEYDAGDDGLGTWVAITFAFSGDEEALFEWLERLAADGNLGFAPNMAFFEDYEDDPRFRELMASINHGPQRLDAIRFELPLAQ